jgi:hypothetical protein
MQKDVAQHNQHSLAVGVGDAHPENRFFDLRIEERFLKAFVLDPRVHEKKKNGCVI